MKEFYAVHILRYKGNSMKQYRKFMIDTYREKDANRKKRAYIYLQYTYMYILHHNYCITKCQISFHIFFGKHGLPKTKYKIIK